MARSRTALLPDSETASLSTTTSAESEMAKSTTTDESSTGAPSTFGAGGGESAKSTEPSESSEATEDAAEGTGETAPVANCSSPKEEARQPPAADLKQRAAAETEAA